MDLPGVNAQEKTKEELMEALTIGAQEMLATEISFQLFLHRKLIGEKYCGQRGIKKIFIIGSF